MRTVVTVLAVLAAAAAWCAAPLEWDATDHDFGVIREADGPASCTFTVKNTGTEPLLILGARANCGCTTPSFPKGAIPPGASADVTVVYDPEARPGRFHKKVMVETSASERPTALSVHGTVLATDATLDKLYSYSVDGVRLKNRLLIVGDIGPLESRGTYLECYNATADTIYPKFSTPDTSIVSVMARPDTVPPGEQFIYSIVVGSNKRGRWGHQTDSVALYPRGTDSSIVAEVNYNVKEDFSSLTPEQLARAPMIVTDTRIIDLGRVEADKPVETKIKITNRGTSAPLKIRGINCNDPAVTVKFKNREIKKGKTETVQFTVLPGARAHSEGLIDAEVEIITNDPRMSVAKVRIVGEIAPRK